MSNEKVTMLDQSEPRQTTTTFNVGTDQNRIKEYVSVSAMNIYNACSENNRRRNLKHVSELKPKISLSNKGAAIGTLNLRSLYTVVRMRELTVTLEDNS